MTGTSVTVQIAATVSAGVLIIVASIHFYWAAGGTWGKNAALPSAGGRAVIAPSSLGTAAVGVALGASAFVVAACALQFFTGSTRMTIRLAAGVLAIAFGLRAIGEFRYFGVFKKIKGTSFARLDTLIYSPLCFVLCVLIAIVATVSR